MMAKQSLRDPLQTFDMLPPVYHSEVRFGLALRRWLAVNLSLLVILSVLGSLATVRLHQEHLTRQRIVTAAMPLIRLRDDCQRLQLENDRRGQWCRLVESARPDDNAFQSLAAIASAASSDGENVMIDQVLIRLPLESADVEPKSPMWSAGSVSVTARVASPDLAHDWIDRLNASDRVYHAVIDDSLVDLTGSSVEITAIPRTTRVLP